MKGLEDKDVVLTWIADHPMASLVAGFVVGLAAGSGLIPTAPTLKRLKHAKPTGRIWRVAGPMMERHLAASIKEAAAAVVEETVEGITSAD